LTFNPIHDKIKLSGGGHTPLKYLRSPPEGGRRRRYKMAKKVNINKDFVAKFVAESGYPEVGHFADQKDLQKFYKHLSDEQLLEWIELEGLDFKPADSQPINRMRMAMAVLYKHFPKKQAGKKKSKYADYSDEQLMTLLMEHDVPCEVTEDERIMRMRAIMALIAHKVIE
jgi:hypothetical protein